MPRQLPQFGKTPEGGRFSRWMIVIGGFTQHLGRPSGSELLFNHLWELVDGNTCVQLHTWRDDWPKIAEFMHRNTDHRRPVKIHVFSYSWGFGWGFKKLAQELEKRGMVVNHAVGCDPVYRTAWMPEWLPLNPLSMLRLPTIEIPANVRMVDHFYQRQDRPMGHKLEAADPEGTIIHPGVQLQADHAYMDDQYKYHVKALEVAGVI